MKAASLLFLFLFSLKLSAQARNSDYATLEESQQLVKDFKESGTLESYENLDDISRTEFLIDLFRGKLQVKDKKKILEVYFHQATTAEKMYIYEMSFVYAINMGDASEAIRHAVAAAEFARPHATVALNFACTSLESLGTDNGGDYDESHLTEAESVKALHKAVTYFSVGHASCDFFNSNKSLSNTLIESGLLGQEKTPTAKDPKAYSPTIYLPSSCSSQQIFSVFNEAYSAVNRYKFPNTQILSFQEASCRIHGIFRKTKTDFEFIMNQSLPGYQPKPLKFKSLDELIGIFKTLQKPRNAPHH